MHIIPRRSCIAVRAVHSAGLAWTLAACAAVPANPFMRTQPVPGQRIRIEVRGAELSRQTGSLVALTPDSLVLRRDSTPPSWDDAARVAVAVPSISRYAIGTGVRNHAPEGAYIGGSSVLLVSMAGFLWGACLPCEANVWYVTAGGMAVGALIGSTVEHEDFRKRSLRSLRVEVTPLPGGGVGIGASVGLRRRDAP
jgi:hypothetical protein